MKNNFVLGMFVGAAIAVAVFVIKAPELRLASAHDDSGSGSLTISPEALKEYYATCPGERNYWCWKETEEKPIVFTDFVAKGADGGGTVTVEPEISDRWGWAGGYDEDGIWHFAEIPPDEYSSAYIEMQDWEKEKLGIPAPKISIFCRDKLELVPEGDGYRFQCWE